MFQFGGSGHSGAKSVKRSKLPPYDFQILEGWYRHASRNKQSNLVVVLQDIETFEAQVLQDFISICRWVSRCVCGICMYAYLLL